MEVWQVFVAAGIPSALCAFLFWLIERKISKTDKQREEERAEAMKEAKVREARNEEFMILLLDTTQAAVVLSEATARAVQRIPDAKCNGDMHAALDVAEELQEKQRQFMEQLGVESLYRKR